MDVNRQYLKAEEVAEILGMDVSGIYKMCRDRTLPSIRVGVKTVRIPRAGLDAFLAKATQGREVVESALGERDSGPVAALEGQVESFTDRVGHTPHEFVELLRSGGIPDDPASADLAIEALSLRSAIDRAGQQTAPASEAFSVSA